MFNIITSLMWSNVINVTRYFAVLWFIRSCHFDVSLPLLLLQAKLIFCWNGDDIINRKIHRHDRTLNSSCYCWSWNNVLFGEVNYDWHKTRIMFSLCFSSNGKHDCEMTLDNGIHELGKSMFSYFKQTQTVCTECWRITSIILVFISGKWTMKAITMKRIFQTNWLKQCNEYKENMGNMWICVIPDEKWSISSFFYLFEEWMMLNVRAQGELAL